MDDRGMMFYTADGRVIKQDYNYQEAVWFFYRKLLYARRWRSPYFRLKVLFSLSGKRYTLKRG